MNLKRLDSSVAYRLPQKDKNGDFVRGSHEKNFFRLNSAISRLLPPLTPDIVKDLPNQRIQIRANDPAGSQTFQQGQSQDEKRTGLPE